MTEAEGLVTKELEVREEEKSMEGASVAEPVVSSESGPQLVKEMRKA